MKNYSRLILGAGVWVHVGLVSLSYMYIYRNFMTVCGRYAAIMQVANYFK